MARTRKKGSKAAREYARTLSKMSAGLRGLSKALVAPPGAEVARAEKEAAAAARRRAA
jgi:hypothetical protein